MEKRPIFPMTQLDTLVTTQELQLMKLMLPYIPANMRGMLAVYIKFTEFTNTLHLFHSTGNGSSDGPIHSKSIHSPEDILQDLSAFMNPSEADNISMMFNMMNIMKQMDPSGFSHQGNNGEMSEMMDLFDNIMKGNDKHDGLDDTSRHE